MSGVSIYTADKMAEGVLADGDYQAWGYRKGGRSISPAEVQKEIIIVHDVLIIFVDQIYLSTLNKP